MKLKAITYSYFQDGVLQNKVVGIFEKDELENALKDIRYFFKEQKVRLVNDKYDKSCDNYFLEFDNKERSYFYTSDYTLNELDL